MLLVLVVANICGYPYNVPSCSLSEWRQAQCRDGESEGCGDPCEQAIITSKQAEEVVKLICTICHGRI